MADQPRTTLLRPGNTNCGGCGLSLAMQMLSLAAGPHKLKLVIPACCATVAGGTFPQAVYGVPAIMSTFASAPAVATGLARVAALNGDPSRTIVMAGDGGTFDIGLATLSAAAERNEDILFVCYDNEIYGNTGGQRSSATPLGAATSNTPAGKPERKKDILAIMAAHRIPYAASVSLAHREDALRKFALGVEAKGFRFLHVLSPCPTGWKSEPAQGLELVRLAVRAGLWPVYEMHHGGPPRINIEPDFSRAALERYLSLQRRFRTSSIEALEAAIAQEWQSLRSRL